MDPTKELQLDMNRTYEGCGWIRTRNGKFSLENPEFVFDDIAHALSMVMRYNGHTLFPISVAEHSVNVARIIRMRGGSAERCAEGLMHDATEAYLSDLPAPFKQFLPDWQEIDTRLEIAMREYFNLGPKTATCKEADWIALFIEAYFLIPGKGEDFQDPQNLRPVALEMMWEDGGVLQPKNAGWEADKSMFYQVGNIYGLTEEV